MGHFDGLVVWITGGGSGIGRALAREFARQGADVAVSGRRTDRIQETVAEIEGLGRRGLAVTCDVRDDAVVSTAVAAVVSHFGRLDVAVANAGMGVMGRFEQLSDAEWHRQFDVNVFGVINTARHALPELRKTGGRLALVGSVAAMLCAPRSGAYSASKFALRAIGLTLSQELHGSGVTCTTIHPGFVASEIAQVDNQGRFEARRKDRRPRLLIWPTDRAARRMVRAIDQRRREYVFTAHGKIGAWLGRHLPGMVHFIMTRAGGQSMTTAPEKRAS
jgi:NAD(P)-dependent dehydrogenase (short-subunit alcohol dehydrogenase family)